ncbi:hypothetical protein NC796_03135 [Aliifodinibius sp. S!AR15-10]|uniref:hypothetical protein n=1 Tax=Aliifodinibius sp. S!AR15-10 TaxID=2950437 RepID=UPI00285AB38E|nr:hypothetical protein [Aliifodinibius sp. S!AR15-10]MDR8390119.1 hypothetical protein [Aliifodinibius sp. S!AR15-10]
MKAYTLILTIFLLAVTASLEAQQIVKPKVQQDPLSFGLIQEDSLITILPNFLKPPKNKQRDNCIDFNMPIYKPSEEFRDAMPQMSAPDLEYNMPVIVPDSSCWEGTKSKNNK